MGNSKITIENYLPTNFENYLEESLTESLNSEVPYIATKFLYTATGSILFKKFTESSNYHSSNYENSALNNYPELYDYLYPSKIVVELGAGLFERTLKKIEEIKKNIDYSFWAVDISPEPAFTTIKNLQKFNKHCRCKLILADYELSITSLFDPNIESLNILWLGNSCVNIFPSSLRYILEKMKPNKGVDRTITIGVDLADPSNHQSEKVLSSDKEGFFSEFRKSSLMLIEEKLSASVPWKDLTWNTYYKSEINAYVSIFHTNIDWCLMTKDSKKILFEFKRNTEIIVGYSHSYTLNSINNLIVDSGWRIESSYIDRISYYSILILKPFI